MSGDRRVNQLGRSLLPRRRAEPSGIISDANAYATEIIGNPRYPFDLLCRVITVSMRTLDIVESLPTFDIVEG
jgi:hypothetical protein